MGDTALVYGLWAGTVTDDDDDKTILRPPTPSLDPISETDDTSTGTGTGVAYGIVPADALLKEHAKRRERELPQRVRDERLSLLGPTLLTVIAAESARAMTLGSTSFTVRWTHSAAGVWITPAYRVTFRDGFPHPLPVADVVAWLAQRPELRGYTVEDTLVGLRFAAEKYT